MPEEEGAGGFFDDEKEEFEAFFNFYEKMFNETVAMMPAVYEDEEFEIDLVVGEESNEYYGVRVLQFAAEEEEEIKPKESTKDKLKNLFKSKKSDKAEEEDIDLGDEEEDEEEDDYDLMLYDFIWYPEAKMTGKPVFKVELGEEEGDPNGMNLLIFSEDGEADSNLTCVVLINPADKENPKKIMAEHPDFEC